MKIPALAALLFPLLFLVPSSASAMAQASATSAPTTQTTTSSAAAAPAASPATAQAYNLSPDKLAKAEKLSRFRTTMSFVQSLWGLAVLWILLATGAVAALERWAKRQLPQRWLQGLLFFAVFLVLTSLPDLPLDMLSHWVSTRYGISVQGWAGWFADLGKGLALTLVFGPLLMLLFNWIVRRSPRRFWLWGWLVMLPLMIFGTMGSPYLEPLFNKFEPLAQNHAQLVGKLEQVVARTGTNIPPERMFLMKASLKSNGLNAYVSGLGQSKRIVVWDTTAGRIPDDEIQFIFGHESGHYVLNHIVKDIAASAIFTFFLFWFCAAGAQKLARRVGPRWGLFELLATESSSTQPLSASAEAPPTEAEEQPAPTAKPESLLASRTGFVVLILVVAIAQFFLTPVGNTFSRHQEHEADIYGQEAMHGLVADPQKTAVSAFNHLGEAWLEDPNPSPFIEFWEYSHPSVQTRARFASQYNPWANGGHGRFFTK
jgi:Zn-dependent protease with chaperone function